MNQRIYVDEDYDLKVAAPTGWYRMNSRQYTAPGDLLRVWNPGSETVIMVYRYLYEELVMPMELLDKTAEIASEQLHADILEQELRTIAGKRATWLVFSGPGTGGMVNGRGNIQTVQHVVAFPRVDDTIVFLLVSPEADYKKYAPDFENMLASLEMGGHQTDAQANDK